MTSEDRTIPESEVPEPPQPPRLRTGVRLYPYQRVGIPLFFLVVALALLGVFGERREQTGAERGALGLRVDYPSRFRYKQRNQIRVWVTNRGALPIDTVTVSFDSAYILRFSDVAFTPAVRRPFRAELAGVEPGETRLVLAEIQAERYGRHAGEIAVAAGKTGTVRVRVHTLVFP